MVADWCMGQQQGFSRGRFHYRLQVTRGDNPFEQDVPEWCHVEATLSAVMVIVIVNFTQPLYWQQWCVCSITRSEFDWPHTLCTALDNSHK